MHKNTNTHKNNPDDFTITFYCPVGRKRGTRVRTTLTQSQNLADRWSRMTGGSAVVHRCLYNTAISRAKWFVQSSRDVQKS